MWWTILIAFGLAVTQATTGYLGWHVTVRPLAVDDNRLRARYKATFLLATLIAIGLVVFATYRQEKTSQESNAAIMRMGKESGQAQQTMNHKLDAIYALLQPRPNPPLPSPKIANNPPKQTTPPVAQVRPQTPSITLPATTTLTVSQRPKVSTRADAKYETEVVVQTTTEIPSVKLLVQCDKDLVAVTSDTTMVAFLVREGILRDHPNVFLFSYASAQPPFGPAHPLVFGVWSKEPVTCNQAATF